MLSLKAIYICSLSYNPHPQIVVQLQLHLKHVFFTFFVNRLFISRETLVYLRCLYFHFSKSLQTSSYMKNLIIIQVRSPIKKSQNILSLWRTILD